MSVKHVIVDGSNIATEGRDTPSLAQLDEAMATFAELILGGGPATSPPPPPRPAQRRPRKPPTTKPGPDEDA